jgi:hypothetical protein
MPRLRITGAIPKHPIRLRGLHRDFTFTFNKICIKTTSEKHGGGRQTEGLVALTADPDLAAKRKLYAAAAS